MAGRLDGTVALVTGASSGIGEATARALAAQGAAVAVVARRKDRLDRLAQSVDGRVLAIEADITDRAQAQAAVERTVAELGRLDTLVNNAGLMLLGNVVDASLEEWDRMIALNVQALITTTHAALPHLLAAAQDSPRRVADVVNISSTSGRVTSPMAAVYALTKHGIGAFSDSLRQEVTKRHVRVGLVEPGATATELGSHNRDEILQGLGERFGDLEILAAEDIGDAVCFIVTRDRRVAVNEILVRPTEQEE